MRTVRKLFWAALPLAAACSSVAVHTDYNATADFSRYKTYYWAKTPTTRNPIMADRIVAKIDGELYAKGWRKAAEGQADAAVAAHVTASEKERLDTMYNTMGPGGWYGSGGYGWVGAASASYTVVHYTVGTLIVDIFDAQSKKAIWHATAESTVTNDAPEVQQKIDEATQKMFKDFPPLRAAGNSPR
jgi:hypothetical protein